MSDEHAARQNSKVESVSELVAGLAVVILAILGLAGAVPNYLVAIATIIFGVELLLYGTGQVAELTRILGQKSNSEALVGAAVGGLSVAFLAGVAGIVLGILALLGVVPTQLVAIAVIGFGGALLVSANASMRLRSLGVSSGTSDLVIVNFANGIAADTAGMQTMSGLTAIVLGILALANMSPVNLVLIALLAIGAFAVLSSAFINNGLLKAFRVGSHA
jgi:hypothetical protein